jgi:hypothetical protein
MAGNDRLRSVLHIVAVFMALPFALVGAILFVIRSAQRQLDPHSAPPEKATSATVATDGSPTTPG